MTHVSRPEPDQGKPPGSLAAARACIERGYARMAARRVVICGLARDCAPALAKLLPQLERLGARFSGYRIIVVENDSVDATGTVLLKAAAADRHIVPIRFSTCPWATSTAESHDGENWWFSAARMARMNFARNLYLEAAEAQAHPDILIVVDLDILAFDTDGIAHTLGLETRWDFMASNGQRYTLRHPLRRSVYWDTYVYEPHAGYAHGVLTARDIRRAQVSLTRELRAGSLLPVRSAFGGLCVYRFAALKSHRYHLIENRDPEVRVLCDHTTLHRSMALQDRGRGFINPFQTVVYEPLRATMRRTLRLRALFR